MRNLKRALSLALASVMVLGMMVVGTSAVGYKDVSSEQNQEAIEVLQAVGIMTGDENGNFNPDANVTRNEMAVIMSNLLNLDYDYYRGVNKFTDVPTWAAPYVAACVAEGVTAGIGNNQYGGSNNVTAAQAALMLMKALGYFQYAEDFGDDWQVATVRQASYISLFDGVKANAETALTRNQVAQMVLNALKSNMVDFTGDVGSKVTINGAEINIGYKAEYTDRTNADKKYNSIDTGITNIAENDKYYVQLGEELYDGDLKLKGTTDEFERPANNWRFEGKDIGTYADEPDLTYTKKVEAGDIYKDLGLGQTIDKSKVEIYVDGVENNSAAPVAIKKSSDTKVGVSGNGVLTEVFYNDKDESIVIAQINTYVGEVVRTVAATSKKDAYVVFSLESVKPAGVSGNQEFETTADFEDEAKVLYTYSLKDDEVESLATAQLVSGTATRVENNKKNTDENKAIYIEETKYSFAVMAAGVALEDTSVDVDYDVYLDAYGYAIYVEEIEEIGNYALLVDYQNKGNFSSNKALLVFADGTEAVVETAKDYKSSSTYALAQGTIVTYQENDGVYTLKPVATTIATGTFTSGSVNPNAKNAASTGFALTSDKAGVALTGSSDKYYTIDKTGSKTVASTDVTAAKSVSTNSNTIFVVYDQDDEDYSVYTGIKNAPTIKSTSTKDVSTFTYVKNGMTKVMFIYVPDSSIVEDSSNKVVFLAGESVSNLIHTKNSDYYEFDAVINGEVTTAKIDWNVVVDGTAKTSEQAKALNGLFKSYSVDKYGVITRLTSYDTYTVGNNKEAINGAEGVDKRSADYTVILGTAPGEVNATITVDDDAKIYYVDEDGNISESSYSAISKDEDDLAYAVVQDYLVKYLLIEEVNTKDDAQAATVSISGKTSVSVGEEVVLTANVTLADSKYDSVIGYQWYKDGTADANKLAGETGKTLTVDTSAAGTADYYVKVTTFNDKVDGKDTAVGTSAKHTLVVNPAPVADMTVTVKTYLRDSGGNIPLDETTQTISADATINAPAYDDYTVNGPSSKTVTFVAGGTATVTFVYDAKTVASISVTAPTKVEYSTSDTTLDTTGMVVTVNYNNGTDETASTGDYTVDSSSITDWTATGTYTITVTHTASGKTDTFTVEIK